MVSFVNCMVRQLVSFYVLLWGYICGSGECVGLRTDFPSTLHLSHSKAERTQLSYLSYFSAKDSFQTTYSIYIQFIPALPIIIYCASNYILSKKQEEANIT